jgi:hypothetical protein
MDIFDELLVTKYVEEYFNKDVIILYVDAEKLNKISKLFRWLYVCVNDILLLLLLLLLILLMCGMLVGLVRTFISRPKVIEYILFQKNLKNATKKLERPGDWYEIDEKWHFLWDFFGFLNTIYMHTVFPFYSSLPPFLPSSLPLSRPSAACDLEIWNKKMQILTKFLKFSFIVIRNWVEF